MAELLVQQLRTGDPGTQAQAARTITCLAVNADYRSMIVKAGAVPHLVPLLSSSDADAQGYAAAALGSLCKHDGDARAQAVEAGAMPRLIGMLGSSDPDAQQRAVGALDSLSQAPAAANAIAHLKGVSQLVQLLGSSTASVQESAACTLCNVAISDPNRAAMVRAGVVEPLVALLSSSKDAAVLRHTAGTLCNLARSSITHPAITAAGGIKELVQLMEATRSSGSDPGIQINTAAALWSLACDPASRQAIIDAGGVHELARLLEGGSPPLVRHTSAAGVAMCVCCVDACSDRRCDMRHLTYNAPTAPSPQAKRAALGALGAIANDSWSAAAIAESNGAATQMLVQMLVSGDAEARRLALAAVRALCSNQSTAAVVAAAEGILPLAQLLTDGGSLQQQQNAAGALWGIATSSEDNRAAILNSGAVPALVALLVSGDSGDRSGQLRRGAVQHEALGALSEVSQAPGAAEAIGLQPGAVEALVELLGSSSTSVQQNAAATLWRLAVTERTLLAIHKQGGVEALLQLLPSSSSTAVQHRAAGALCNLAGLCKLPEHRALGMSKFTAAGGIVKLAEVLRHTDGQVERCLEDPPAAATELGQLHDLRHLASMALCHMAVSVHWPDGREEALAAGHAASHAGTVALAVWSLLQLLQQGDLTEQQQAAAALEQLTAWSDKDRKAEPASCGEAHAAVAKNGWMATLVEALGDSNGSGSRDGQRRHPRQAALTRSASRRAAAQVQAAVASTLAALASRALSAGAPNCAAGGVPALVRLLDSPDAAVAVSACAALWAIAAGGGDGWREVAGAGCIESLVSLLRSQSAAVQQKAAGTVWELCKHDAAAGDLTAEVVAAGAIGALLQALKSSDGAVQYEAAGALNAIGCIQVQLQALASAGAKGELEQLLSSSSNCDARRQAADALRKLQLHGGGGGGGGGSLPRRVAELLHDGLGKGRDLLEVASTVKELAALLSTLLVVAAAAWSQVSWGAAAGEGEQLLAAQQPAKGPRNAGPVPAWAHG